MNRTSLADIRHILQSMKLVSTTADKLFRFPDPIPESQRVALTNRIFRVRISSGFLRSLLCLRFDGETAKRRKG